MAVPNIFGTATAAIPLSQLDTNFATAITLGNTAVYLGNTTTSLGNVTLTNVTISSGNVTVAGANISGTANVSTLIVTGNQTSLGNVTVTGNVSANIVTVAAGAVGTPSITTTGDTNTGIFFPAADTIAFAEGGAEVARFDSSGNFGIGTATPQTRLHAFSSAANTTVSIQGSLSAGANTPTLDFTGNNGAYSFGARIQAIRDTSAGGYSLAFGTTTNNAAESSAPTERMRINSSGNVGIGTSSPSGPLNVVAATASGLAIAINGRSSDSLGAMYFYANNGSTQYATITASATEFRHSSVPAAAVQTFYTNGSERMRIDASGNVGIGLTSPGTRLLVSKNDNTYYLTDFENSFTSGNGYVNRMYFSGSAPNSTSSIFSAMVDNAASRCIIYANGGIHNYQANNVNLSDRREKTNFAPAKSYLDVICAIPVQTFNYLDQNLEEDDGLTLGVVAQDVQAVAPELVSESDWSPEKDGSKMRLSIYQTDLQYALMKCIQEQQALIITLTARITALEQA